MDLISKSKVNPKNKCKECGISLYNRSKNAIYCKDCFFKRRLSAKKIYYANRKKRQERRRQKKYDGTTK